MTTVFLDFEASSLNHGSFPVEIGWVDATGQGEAYLIRPAPEWLLPTPLSNWSLESEKIHGISLAELMADGVDHRVVAARAMEAFDRPDITLVADSAFDEAWLNLLLRAAGTTVQFAVIPVQNAFVQACRPLLRLLPPVGAPGRREAEQRVRTLATELIARCDESESMRPGVRHRALADATRLWKAWRAIGDEAERLAARGSAG